jgi:hypothetical protein
MALRSGMHRGRGRDKSSSLFGPSTQKEHRNSGEEETFSDGGGLDNSGTFHLRPNPNAAWISSLLKALGRWQTRISLVGERTMNGVETYPRGYDADRP